MGLHKQSHACKFGVQDAALCQPAEMVEEEVHHVPTVPNNVQQIKLHSSKRISNWLVRKVTCIQRPHHRPRLLASS